MSDWKHAGDIATLPTLGGGGLLASWAGVAGQLTPILTVLMLVLCCAWYIWRMVDRIRFGPNQKRDDDA